MRVKVSDWRGLCLRKSAKWTDFVAQSLHWKLPFPTQVRDWFDDWVVGGQFDIYCLHHAVFRNLDSEGLQAGRPVFAAIPAVVEDGLRSPNAPDRPGALLGHPSPLAKRPFLGPGTQGTPARPTKREGLGLVGAAQSKAYKLPTP